jgi:hypothetical protein
MNEINGKSVLMNAALRKDYFGYRATCVVCGYRKKPVGRSAPLELHFCDSACPGYFEEPFPSHLWPEESEADFGYKVPR